MRDTMAFSTKSISRFTYPCEQVFGSEELLISILSRLPKLFLLTLELVSTSWKQTIRDSQDLWKTITWNDFEPNFRIGALGNLIAHGSYKVETICLQGCEAYDGPPLGFRLALLIPRYTNLKLIELEVLSLLEGMVVLKEACVSLLASNSLSNNFRIRGKVLQASSLEEWLMLEHLSQDLNGLLSWDGIHIDFRSLGRLSDDHVKAFTTKIEESQSLCSLQLSGEGESVGEFASEVCRALHRNTSLTHLTFNVPLNHQQAATTIPLALAHNNTIRSLRLTGDSEETVCPEPVCRCLLVNTSLTELEFDRFHVGVEQPGQETGEEAVAASLAVNSTLRILRIKGGMIAKGFLGDMTRTLMQNSSLVELDIEGVHVSSQEACQLSEALAKNSSLRILKMKVRSFQHNFISKLANGLEQNSGLIELEMKAYEEERAFLHEDIEDWYKDNVSASDDECYSDDDSDDDSDDNKDDNNTCGKDIEDADKQDNETKKTNSVCDDEIRLERVAKDNGKVCDEMDNASQSITLALDKASPEAVPQEVSKEHRQEEQDAGEIRLLSPEKAVAKEEEEDSPRFISSASAAAMARALRTNTSLRVLKITTELTEELENDIWCEDLVVILTAILQRSAPLTALSLPCGSERLNEDTAKVGRELSRVVEALDISHLEEYNTLPLGRIIRNEIKELDLADGIHKLDFSPDSFQFLMKALRMNSSLTKIDMAGRDCEEDEFPTLVKTLVRGGNDSQTCLVRKLNLCGSLMTFFPELPGLIDTVSSFQLENYNGIPLGDLRRGTLRELDLNRQCKFPFSKAIGLDGAMVLASLLKTNTSLTSLSLQGNLLRAEGVVAVLRALAPSSDNSSSSVCPLHSLDLRRTECVDITPDLTEAVQALGTTQWKTYNGIPVEAIREGTVRMLDLSTRSKDRSWVPAFFGDRVDLGPCGVDGLLMLIKLIKAGCTLTGIDLSDDNLTAASAKFLSTSLSSYKPLRHLHFRNNCLDSEAVDALLSITTPNRNYCRRSGPVVYAQIPPPADATRSRLFTFGISLMSRRCTLVKLEVVGVKIISSLDVKFISLAISNNKCLRILKMQAKQFEGSLVPEIAASLLKNTTLIELDVEISEESKSEAFICKAGASALAAVFEKNTTLCILKLRAHQNFEMECDILNVMLLKLAMGGPCLTKRQLHTLELPSTSYEAKDIIRGSRFASLVRDMNISGWEIYNGVPLGNLQRGSIQELDLSSEVLRTPEALGPDTFLLLVKVLRTNTTLTSLNMSGLSMSETEFSILINAVLKRKTVTIRQLDLSGWCPEHVDQLRQPVSLITQAHLECYNRIPLGSLRRNEITELDMQCNTWPIGDIGMDGGLVLADALRANTTLTALNLKGNTLRSEGVATILKSCAPHITGTPTCPIQHLDMRDNGCQKYIRELVCAVEALGSNAWETYNGIPLGEIRRGERAILDPLSDPSTKQSNANPESYSDQHSYGVDGVLLYCTSFRLGAIPNAPQLK